MTILYLLIPVTLAMGAVGLWAFYWSLNNGQYDDMAGDAARILMEDSDTPLAPRADPAPNRPDTSRPARAPKESAR